MSQPPNILSSEEQAAVPFWRDIRVLRWVFQIVILLFVVILIYTLATNLITNLAEVGLDLKFDFVTRRAGFNISEGSYFDIRRFVMVTPGESPVRRFGDLDGLTVGVVSAGTLEIVEQRIDQSGITLNIMEFPDEERAYDALFADQEIDAVIGRRVRLRREIGETATRLGIPIGYQMRGVRLKAGLSACDPDENFLRAYLCGATNTVRAAAIGIVLSTILGVIVGIARLSNNWVVSRLALVFIEIMQNTPLLVQLFFWFTLIRALPRQRIGEIISIPGESVSLGPVNIPPLAYFSQRAAALPGIELFDSFQTWRWFLLAAMVLGAGAWRLRVYLRERRGRPPTGQFWWATTTVVVVLAAGWLLVPGQPLRIVTPALEGDPIANYTGGWVLSNNFQALLLGLVLYTGAFIAEVVRAGIQAVPHGQIEAATALGLKRGLQLRLIILPQAMRVIIPPLINQYLNLTKNSSLAIAVAFPDLFNISQTIGNQSGQNTQIIFMVMGTYLAMSLLISLVLNVVNQRMQIKER